MAWRMTKPSTVSKSSRPSSSSTDVLPSVARDFYLEHPEVAAITPDQAAAIRKEHSIRIIGGKCPNPVKSFLQASFPQYMLDTLKSAGYTAPTAIQRQGWPVAMSGRDVIGLAETGSGKTLTYLLPALVCPI